MDDVFQAFFRAFLELLLEIVWKGPGYLILRLLRPCARHDFEGAPVLLVGTLFWVVFVLVIWGVVALL